MPEYDPDEAKRHVAVIQRQLDTTAAEIRADKSLTDAGRRRELALATLRARRSADDARQQHAAEREQKLAAARRVAFGSLVPVGGADALSARDAADRAAKLTNSADASAALSQAILLDDRPYAKAIAAHAYSRGWSAVAEKYGDEFGCRSFVDELSSIPSGPMTEAADRIVWRVKPPEELRGVDDAGIQGLADAKVSE